jgi:hypothetical protein
MEATPINMRGRNTAMKMPMWMNQVNGIPLRVAPLLYTMSHPSFSTNRLFRTYCGMPPSSMFIDSVPQQGGYFLSGWNNRGGTRRMPFVLMQ